MSRHTRAFTLIELMVSLVILVITTVYLTDLFTRQSRAYTVVENVTEVQHNLRAIAHLIERELRSTGMLVPEAAALCGIDNTNTSDILYVTDSDAVNPGTNTNLGADINTGYSGTGSDALIVSNAVLDGAAFYDNNGDGIPDSDFQEGGGVIVVDPNNAAAGASCGVVTDVIPGANDRIDVAYPPGAQVVGGFGLVAIPAHVYQINGNSQLLRNGVVLTDNVDDFQFAAFYDINENDIMDDEDLEYVGSDGGPIYESDGFDNKLLRELRVTLVARSRLPDPEFTTGTFQAFENRVAPGGTDGFRRRSYTTVVRPRNVGNRQGAS